MAKKWKSGAPGCAWCIKDECGQLDCRTLAWTRDDAIDAIVRIFEGMDAYRGMTTSEIWWRLRQYNYRCVRVFLTEAE